MRSSIIYTPPDIRMISSRRLRWTVHMAHGGVENTFWLKRLRLGIDRKIIIKWVLLKQV